MKNTKYLLVGVWCVLVVGFAAVRGTSAFAAGSGQSAAIYSGQQPVLLADGGEGSLGASCNDIDPNTGDNLDAPCGNSLECSSDFQGVCVTAAGSGSTGCGENYPNGCPTGTSCSSTDPANDPDSKCEPNGAGTVTGGNGTYGAACDGSDGQNDAACGVQLNCTNGTCGGDGSPGAFCDSSAGNNLPCADGSACPASGVCPAASGLASAGAACTTSTDCDYGLACSNNTCVQFTCPAAGVSCGMPGETCQNSASNGLQCAPPGSFISPDGTGIAGSGCSSSNSCTYGFMCSPSTMTCMAANCTSVGQSCGLTSQGEVCGVSQQHGLQCGPPGQYGTTAGAGSGSKPTSGSGTTTTNKASGSTTTQYPQGSTITPNGNGTTTVTNPTTGVSTTYPAGTQISTDPATGVVTAVTPSTTSSTSSSGIATTPGVCGAGLGAFDSISLFPKICNFNDFVVAVVNVMLSVLAIIAAFFIILGGFRYVTSNGDSEAAGKGLSTVKNAAIGLAIAILAYAIIAVVVNTASSLAPGTSSSSSSTTTTTSSGAAPAQ